MKTPNEKNIQNIIDGKPFILDLGHDDKIYGKGSSELLKAITDDIIKGRSKPIGSKSPSGKYIKTADGWKPVKKEKDKGVMIKTGKKGYTSDEIKGEVNKIMQPVLSKKFDNYEENGFNVVNNHFFGRLGKNKIRIKGLDVKHFDDMALGRYDMRLNRMVDEWRFTIDFKNKKGKKDVLGGTLVAYGIPKGKNPTSFKLHLDLK